MNSTRLISLKPAIWQAAKIRICHHMAFLRFLHHRISTIRITPLKRISSQIPGFKLKINCPTVRFEKSTTYLPVNTEPSNIPVREKQASRNPSNICPAEFFGKYTPSRFSQVFIETFPKGILNTEGKRSKTDADVMINAITDFQVLDKSRSKILPRIITTSCPIAVK